MDKAPNVDEQYLHIEQYRQKLADLEANILPEQRAVLENTAPALRGIAKNAGSAVVASYELQRKTPLMEPAYIKALEGLYHHAVEFRQARRTGSSSTTQSGDWS